MIDGADPEGAGAAPELTAHDRMNRYVMKWQHFHEAGRLDLAEAELRNALREFPDEPELHALLAFTLEDLERPTEAEEAARATLARIPTHPTALCVLARVRMDAGRHREAEQFVLDGLAADPNSVQLLVVYGYLLLQTQHRDKAESVARRVLALAPEDNRGHQLMSFILQGGRAGAAANHAADKGMQLDPQAAVSHLAVGAARYRSGRPFAARRHFRTAVRIDPTNTTAVELYLESDRACRWLFLPMYYWSLLTDRIPGKQFAVWGAFVAFIYLRDPLGIPDHVATTLAVCYLAFAVYTWVADPLAAAWIRIFPPR